MKLDIAIVGGGLSGLCAAHLLERHGVYDYVLFEARETLGGRISSGLAPSGTTLFDLGGTWFWPSMQPELANLIAALDLSAFEQNDVGDMLIDRSPHNATTRFHGIGGDPKSFRIEGGMGALVAALVRRLEAKRIRSGCMVAKLSKLADGIALTVIGPNGSEETVFAQKVLIALPPRLAMNTITFDPPLPEGLAQAWQRTATWMAPHAKYVAVYDRPFWRNVGLSGEARSAVGPLAEIHDASPLEGAGALFGFFGIPAESRGRLPPGVLIDRCRAQLVRIFGAEASGLQADFIKDWATDPLTATADDLKGDAGLGQTPRPMAADGPWRDTLIGIGSEWSPSYSGYIAGAEEAARNGVSILLDVGLWKPHRFPRSNTGAQS
jgi:monoamine oxidase